MENFFSISHVSPQSWIELRNLPDMNYERLADNELVRECGENPCPEAWEEFIRRFHHLIAGVALRACREWSHATTDVVEDMVQNTFLKLCADNYSLLRNFQPHHAGAFLGYLKRITANVVYDHFRRQYADIRDVTKTVDLNEAVHQLRQETGSLGTADLEIFLNEINSLLLQRGHDPAKEKERAIFWLYYSQGLTAKEIALIQAMNLTVKGVESVLHRLMLYIKEALVMKD